MRRLGCIAALVVALLVLRAVGHGPLAFPPVSGGLTALHSWWAARDPATVVMSLVRLLAIGLAGYLLAVALLDTVAQLVGLRALDRIVAAVALPPVRRLLVGGAGLALVAASTSVVARPAVAAAVAASAAAPSTPPLLVGLPTTSTTTAAQPSSTPPPPPRPTIALPPATQPPGTAPSTWTVRHHDNLWLIAQSTLTTYLGRPPTNAEIVPYWLALISSDRAALRYPSDPNLVYEGQIFDLPPLQQPD